MINTHKRRASCICVCLPFGRSYFTLDPHSTRLQRIACLRHMAMAYRLVNARGCAGSTWRF